MKYLILLFLLPNFAFASMVDRVNEYRVESGKKAAVELPGLCDLWNFRFEQIRSEFDHSGWRDFVNRFQLKRYGDWYENLAKDFKSDSDIIKAWENSPSHNANLLASYQYICIKKSGNYVGLWAWKTKT